MWNMVSYLGQNSIRIRNIQFHIRNIIVCIRNIIVRVPKIIVCICNIILHIRNIVVRIRNILRIRNINIRFSFSALIFMIIVTRCSF